MLKKHLDARGLACPKPVLLAKEALVDLGEEPGRIEMVVDNKAAVENLSRMAASYGIKAIVNDAIDGNYNVVVEKTAGIVKGELDIAENVCKPAGIKKAVLLASDTIGAGSDELGAILMRSFLYSLTKADNLPTNIILMNSGVKLAVTGSPVLEELSGLQTQGVVVLACGTCLDYYNLKSEIAVGTISNMYEITDVMLAVDSVIRL